MKYICTECNFIYDENLGLPEEGISPQTDFEDLWSEFNCPLCYSSNENFFPLQEEIIYFEDVENLSSLEASHYPFYEIKDDIIRINFSDWEREEDDEIIKCVLLDEYGDIITESSLNEDLEFEYEISDFSSIEILVVCTWHWTFSTGLIDID